MRARTRGDRRSIKKNAFEFQAGDLALDAAGAEQILANKHIRLTAAQATAVTDRTEGRPASTSRR